MIQDAIQAHLDSLCKPPGSLGRLEWLAAELCRIQQTLTPRTRPRRAVVFAADHGVVAAGVSAWPPEVTMLMAGAIAAGQAASRVLAGEFHADLILVDVGTLRAGTVRCGSRDLSREAALTVAEFHAAQSLGAAHAEAAARDGMRVVIGGEMGIGNTTAASCVAALVCGCDPDRVVGFGAGADDATVTRKRAVVAAAVQRERPRLSADPLAAIAAVAGLDIAALAGFYQRSTELGLTIVLDGFVTAAGLLIAEHLRPGVAKSVIASHAGAEPGHAVVLDRLGLSPLLNDWGLRLGEASGALLALPLLDAAAAICTRMATLEQVGAERAT